MEKIHRLIEIPKNPIFAMVLLCIMVGIIALQIYAFIFVFPVERDIYEKCQIKIMCELDKIEHPVCDQYDYNIPDIPLDVVGNISID